ncbi:MAG: hypothetical protein LBW85_04060 [Deltaproteobacteria bacterium]|nr:hypothetical protein [Deltaproteobacteria bacterium]
MQIFDDRRETVLQTLRSLADDIYSPPHLPGHAIERILAARTGLPR